MKTTILYHDRDAGETFRVTVLTSDDPQTLKDAARKVVEHHMVAYRQETGYEEPEDPEDAEQSGLERDGNYDCMHPEEAWEEFDPAGKDILFWELNPGPESYRVLVHGDKHDIVQTLDARLAIATHSSHPIDA